MHRHDVTSTLIRRNNVMTLQLWPHSQYILNPDQLDTDLIDLDQTDLHQIAFTLGLI